MTLMRRRMGLALIAALAWTVPCGIWTCSARADYLHFSSLDMTPVRISLVHDVAGKANVPDLMVPRAYIYFVNGFLPGQALATQLEPRRAEVR